jgi:hypothetical protein
MAHQRSRAVELVSAFAWCGRSMAELKPPTDSLTAWTSAEEEAWSSLVSTQLPDVRKAAENWRNGLVAMIGLITAFSVIKGPNDVSGLDRWAAYTVGFLLLLALTCATFGAWMALAAAYGTPRPITKEAVRNLGGVTGFRFRLAKESVLRLRRARVATIATLLLLAGAIGLTWYGHRSPVVTLDVERKSLPKICGKLMASKDGYIDIKPSASEAIRVSMTDLVAVRGVRECP